MSMPTLTPIEPDSIPDYDGTADNGAKKRGRPAGSGAGSRGAAPRTRATAADKRNVDTALASMGTLYSGATAGLLLAGRPQTASVLAGQIDELQVANRQAFEASPKLAAAISSVGQFSAVGLFFSTNLAVAATIFMSMRAEGAILNAERTAQFEAAQTGNVPL